MTTKTLVLPQEPPTSFTFTQALFQWESVLFALICICYMLSTLFWVHQGIATEANPMLARCLQQGVAVFCGTKLLSFVPMLLFSAWYRTKQPKFIALALRLAIAAYVAMYIIGVGAQFIA